MSSKCPSEHWLIVPKVQFPVSESFFGLVEMMVMVMVMVHPPSHEVCVFLFVIWWTLREVGMFADRPWL